MMFFHRARHVAPVHHLYDGGRTQAHPLEQRRGQHSRRVTNFQRTGALTGLDDAVFNWFYGHNVFGLYITTGGIAIVYYMVPKLLGVRSIRTCSR